MDLDDVMDQQRTIISTASNARNFPVPVTQMPARGFCFGFSVAGCFEFQAHSGIIISRRER